MTIPVKNLVEQTSIRARVSFALTVAEHVIDHIKYDSEGYSLAKQALDLAWKWVEKGEVSGSALYELLENEDDTGLLVHEWEAGDDEIRSAAWIALTMALSYTSWHAYKRMNETAMPEPICEVSEQVLADIVAYASRTGSMDESFVQRLSEYLLSTAKVPHPTEWGRPIERRLLTRL